jgi:hypothetical protein
LQDNVILYSRMPGDDEEEEAAADTSAGKLAGTDVQSAGF